MKTIWYSVEPHDSRRMFHTHDNVDITNDCEADEAAEDCAQNYHYQGSGMDRTWPLEFALYESADGPEVARRMVEREAVPEFTAIRAPQP